MKKRHSLRNQKGFTLIELVSIMIILGVLGSVAIRKYDNLTNTANESVLAVTVEELNARESLICANMKISNEGYTNDTDVYTALNTDIGSRLKWNPDLTIDVGTLQIESQSIVLNRIHSTNSAAGKWQLFAVL